jgi:iron uptake system EfeUOB component EfeO/EfeM
VPGVPAAKQLLIAGALAVALGAPIAGCGRSARVGRDRTLQVAVTEYQVVPRKVQVSAGELTIVVHNEGKMTHNLAISSNNQLVQQTPPIWPGTSSQLSVALPPGSYTISSTLFSDQALGEYGTLTVTR